MQNIGDPFILTCSSIKALLDTNHIFLLPSIHPHILADSPSINHVFPRSPPRRSVVLFHCPAPSCRSPSTVLWAQRSSSSDAARNFIYLTIAAPDVPRADLKLDIQPARLTFSGKSTTKHVTYTSVMEFFEEIDPKESTVNHTDRDIELVLRKKEAKEEFWPRLLKAKAKAHWLKTNFDKVLCPILAAHRR